MEERAVRSGYSAPSYDSSRDHFTSQRRQQGLKKPGRRWLQRQPLKLYFLPFFKFFSSCDFHMKECERDSRTETKEISDGFIFARLRRQQNLINRDFDVLFPSMTVKRSSAVCLLFSDV